MKQETVQGHQPVLLAQAIEALNIHADQFYIDATYGCGGHSTRILEQLGPAGRLLAFDKDPVAYAHGQEQFIEDPRFEIRLGSFVQINDLQQSLQGKVAGILFDLGVSSPQLDQAERGFSFYHDGPLDMRMDPTQGMSAYEWLCSASEKEIARILREYGEERNARKIARNIKSKPIPTRTLELAQRVVEVSARRSPKDKHPATLTFLALRLYLNQELEELRKALSATIDLLATNGRLVAITFHSLEDRIVKQFIHKFSTLADVPHKLPLMNTQLNTVLRPIGRSVVPKEQEKIDNPRSRSARLRCAEKLASAA